MGTPGNSLSLFKLDRWLSPSALAEIPGSCSSGREGGEGPLNPGSSWDLADVRGRFLTVGQEGRGGKQAVCGSDTCHQSLSLDNIGTDTQTYDEDCDGLNDDSDTCQLCYLLDNSGT